MIDHRERGPALLEAEATVPLAELRWRGYVLQQAWRTPPGWPPRRVWRDVPVVPHDAPNEPEAGK